MYALAGGSSERAEEARRARTRGRLSIFTRPTISVRVAPSAPTTSTCAQSGQPHETALHVWRSRYETAVVSHASDPLRNSVR